MKNNNKYSSIAGIALFVLAALFSVCLLLVAVDFGGMSPAQSSFFYILGKIFVRAYGFCSVCIPVFLIAAGLQCFNSKWSAKNGIVLAGSVIPFFTLDAVEHIIRILVSSESGSVMRVKIGATVLIGGMIVAAEFILLMILGEVVANALKKRKNDKNEESVFGDEDDFENQEDENQNQNDDVAALENNEENLDGSKENSDELADKDFDEILSSPSPLSDSEENKNNQNQNDSENEEPFDLKNDKIFNDQKKLLKDLIAVGKTDEEKQKFEEELSESEKSEKKEEPRNTEISAALTNAERQALNEAIAEESKRFEEENQISDEKPEENFSFELPEPEPQVFEDSDNLKADEKTDEKDSDESEGEPVVIENGPENEEETFVDEPTMTEDEPALSEPEVTENEPPVEEETFVEEPIPEVDPTKSPVVDADGNPIEKEEKEERSENSKKSEPEFEQLPDDFFDSEDDEDRSLNSVEGIDDNDDFKITVEDSDFEESKLNDENSENQQKADEQNSNENQADLNQKEVKTENSDELNLDGLDFEDDSENPDENQENQDEFEEPEFEDEDDSNDSDENQNETENSQNEENSDFEEPEFDETEFDGNENQDSSDEENPENPNDEFELPENEDENSDELNLEGLDFEDDSENPDENQNSDESENESNQETPNDEFEIPDFTDDDEDSDEDEESEDEEDSEDEKSNENGGNSSNQTSSAPLVEKRGLLEKAQAFNDAKKLSDAEKKAGITPDDDPYDRAKKLRIASYHISSELLNKYESGQYWIIDDETKLAGEYLTKTLNEFGIQAQVTGIRKGPVVTMFELLPAPGVKLSKIVSLQDNIALALAASSVRIVAPIPGKHAVGIEIPNKKRAVVSFREIIEMDLPEFKKMQIPVILGKDIQGEPHVIDLTKTPHLLIAGSTGSGKSVCVNSMILSILYKRSPEQVKLVLIDPKVVELKLYNDIPHLLTPVITEPKRALQALQYCLCEMERRYACLDGMGVRDIVSYNRKIVEKHIATEKLPYIVVIIDEFADLMATTGKELESAVARLAAMSRAVGIHLVLATQRPSVNVITGLIKANIPSRIAFMVASRQDSQIIIDGIGAEKLLGKGDMLYSSATDPFPTRIQGTLVGDDEVERVVNAVKQYGEPEYIDDEIFVDDDEEESEGPGIFSDGEDPLYDQALQIVIQAGKASASYIQRRLKIGYNRAARLVEEMEARGIVGPQNGSKPREVIHVPS